MRKVGCELRCHDDAQCSPDGCCDCKYKGTEAEDAAVYNGLIIFDAAPQLSLGQGFDQKPSISCSRRSPPSVTASSTSKPVGSVGSYAAVEPSVAETPNVLTTAAPEVADVLSAASQHLSKVSSIGLVTTSSAVSVAELEVAAGPDVSAMDLVQGAQAVDVPSAAKVPQHLPKHLNMTSVTASNIWSMPSELPALKVNSGCSSKAASARGAHGVRVQVTAKPSVAFSPIHHSPLEIASSAGHQAANSCDIRATSRFGEQAAASSAAKVPQHLSELLSINVVTVAGESIGKFTVEPTSTIGELKGKLVSLHNVDQWHQMLLHRQHILEDTVRWTDTSIIDADYVTLAIRPIIALQNTTILEAVNDFYRGGDARTDVEHTYGHISQWNTTEVTDMHDLFKSHDHFNEDLSAWNVSKVTSMACMFKGASMFDGNVNAWNVSSVTDMCSMFEAAVSFNGDLNAWNVGKVTSMHAMFYKARSFNCDLTDWRVSNVITMGEMFRDAATFNGDLSTWNVSHVTSMKGMFWWARSFRGDLSAWSVGNVTNMGGMFYEASCFNSDLSAWNVRNVTDMSLMFYDATSFNTDLSAWDVSQGANTRSIFSNAS